ncbi:nicotinate-nucleotide--dimethylbenzimidazole phosphoribosyltransferase [Nitratireductor basaltis]|uniref:Nicotinate-nucleotide-dimethylbenzimidazole phosphoribosyltransferase n=1 Tax=Nitratireductor basaltis TaxID=472175 RepID=A0A084UAY7_9HYPH|nr:nicotinate-nucleotide--dimethylbenzimidazole phosphoribosyltransferase [Nitratireductor basaltis]KFB10123.1 Nicotinate-nucleotide-dimethylbenzimidazole phosphoribosyltransferase [Nitratireductor basaltis]
MLGINDKPCVALKHTDRYAAPDEWSEAKMTATGLPFDDIRNLARNMPVMDEAAAAKVHSAFGAYGERGGRFEDIAAWFAASTGRGTPLVAKPHLAMFAATHGIAGRLGESQPVASALHRMEEIASGAAVVSQLCAANNVGLNVFDLALEVPVGNILAEDALDERGCAATMAFGMEALANGPDLVCLSTLDDAARISAGALISCLLDESPENDLAREALDRHSGHLANPLEALRRLGGREISAMAGAIIAARTQNIAIILDGKAAIAAAAVVHALNDHGLQHCLLADDAGLNDGVLVKLGLRPLIRIEASEPVAGILAIDIVRSAGAVAAAQADMRNRSAAVS